MTFLMGLTISGVLRAIAKFFFDTALGKYVGVALLSVTVFMSWLWSHDKKIERKVRKEVVSEINKAGKELANEGVRARKKVRVKGAFDRLRKSDCIDC